MDPERPGHFGNRGEILMHEVLYATLLAHHLSEETGYLGCFGGSGRSVTSLTPNVGVVRLLSPGRKRRPPLRFGLAERGVYEEAKSQC